MCLFNKKNQGRYMDKCMVRLISMLNSMFSNDFKTISCCCGHGKYPKTIIIKNSTGNVFELFSNKPIIRTRRFYKRDKKGYYYIPEVINNAK
jgi:hypothetical protein